jgi:hypothetical protein
MFTLVRSIVLAPLLLTLYPQCECSAPWSGHWDELSCWTHEELHQSLCSPFYDAQIGRIFFPWRYGPNLDLGLPPWNYLFHFGFLDFRQSVGQVISSSQGLSTCTQTQKNAHTQTLNIHVLSGIRTHDPGFREGEDSACLRPLGYRDRLGRGLVSKNS